MTAAPQFDNRYRLRGRLTLLSDLYLGDGSVRPESTSDTDHSAAGIATVARGCGPDGREVPVIPGAALKGVLRAYLEDGLRPNDRQLRERIDRLFGRAPQRKTVNEQDLTEDEMGSGGRVDVAYAYLRSTAGAEQLAGWDANRGTGTAACVGIDRVTRGSADRVLYAADYVPRGSVFDVELTAYNLAADGADLGWLLRALEGFQDERHPIRLGANHADWCGRARWELTELQHVDAAGLRAWLKQPAVRPGGEILASVDAAPIQQVALAKAPQSALEPPPRLTLSLVVTSQGPFLINDPSRQNTTSRENGSRQHEGGTPPDRVTRLVLADQAWKVLLPASSFRGALRSQAERALRTLCREATGDPHRTVDPDGLIERLFGHSGLRARIEFSDFLSTKPVGPLDAAPEQAQPAEHVPRHPQEFVAIDRFAGGVSGPRKFNVEAVYQPEFVGTLSVSLDDTEPAALGLLALVLRDLIEGDVTLGAKAAIGYGECRARVTRVALTGRAPWGPLSEFWPRVGAPVVVRAASERAGVEPPSVTAGPAVEVSTKIGAVIQDLIRAFHRRVLPEVLS